jgi:hypothetical protein
VSLAQNSCEVNSLLFLCFVLITGHTHTHSASALLCFYFLVFEIVFLFFFLFFAPQQKVKKFSLADQRQQEAKPASKEA